MTRSPARLLDVGNCDPDHGMIRRMLERHFDVRIDRVMFVDEAVDAMNRNPYDLVLVNRLIFADSSPGIDLHRRIKADPALAGVAIMMITNFPEAQADSVAAGGVPGFGKSTLDQSDTITKLATYLPRRATVAT